MSPQPEPATKNPPPPPRFAGRTLARLELAQHGSPRALGTEGPFSCDWMN